MALLASLKYANTGSGNLAGAIGWVDFGSFTLTTGQTVTGVTATLRDGSTLTFDLNNSNVSGSTSSFVATTPPTFGGAPFGVSGYTGVNGNVVLYTPAFTTGSNRLTLSNINLVDPNGNPVPNYYIYVADGEATGSTQTESQRWITDGGVWTLIDVVGIGASPVLSGVGTKNALLTGTTNGPFNAPVLSTLNPTQVSATVSDVGTGRQGVVFGVSATKIEVQKNIGGRTYSSDQFILDLIGSPSATMTTTGNSNGLQSNTAYAYPYINQNYILTEKMTTASKSNIFAYSTTVSYTNLTPGGTPVPTSTTLPGTIRVNQGDMIIATVTNTPLTGPFRGITFI